MSLKKLKILCCMAYFFSYLSRQNYTAALTEIIIDLDVTKALAGVAVMGSFISYGAFQIVSGVIGDKFKPQNIIFIGLMGSALVNIFVWIFPNIYIINVLWCINGVFQSMIWPPLVRILAEHFDGDGYSKMIVRVSQASYIATVFIYLFVPLVIYFTKWKYVFAITGFAVSAFSVFWILQTKTLGAETNVPCTDGETALATNVPCTNGETVLATNAPCADGETALATNVPCADGETVLATNVPCTDGNTDVLKDVSASETIFEKTKKISWLTMASFGLLPILISAFSAGFMRDGISTWMPTYINEVYSASSFSSILTGAVLPLGCALFLGVMKTIGNKIKNEIKTAIIFFVTALIACGLLAVFFGKSTVLDVTLMAFITLCVHGINLMLFCAIPMYFSKYKKASTMSGILNSFVYLGAAVSIFSLAYISESFGWRGAAVSWAALSAFSALICLPIINKYEKDK